MNNKKLKFYVDNWYEYIEKKNIELLENEIGMSFKDFVMEILNNVYDEYKDVIGYIPVTNDSCAEYIIKPKNGCYSLEDFLINRLLRNISMIEYKEQYFMSESHYDYHFGELLYDKNRIENKLKNILQKRKLVAHELLHGLKTQFVDSYIFRTDEYFKFKEKLKKRKPFEVNNFRYESNDGTNGLCSHIGLEPNRRYLKCLNRENEYCDTVNLDEIFNEIDAIKMSKDEYMVYKQFTNGLCMKIRNPECSNAFITNYAYLIKRLLDKKILFLGMYIEPQVVFNQINIYTSIFQKHYDSDKTALEIILEQLYYIKKTPNDTDLHQRLLNTLYDCINEKNVLNNCSDDERIMDLMSLFVNGLCEINDNQIMPYRGLDYINEFDYTKNRQK